MNTTTRTKHLSIGWAFRELVACYALTCAARPTEYEGKLIDGRSFYFRYRWGVAELGIGDTPQAAINDSAQSAVRLRAGDALSGEMSEAEFKIRFVQLWDARHDIPATPVSTSGLWLVDLDGTVALRDETDPNVRHPFDWARVGDDLPNTPIITVVRALATAGERIIYISGRSDECQAATSVWIAVHIQVAGEALRMRQAGDYRPDTIVKRELYERWVRPLGEVTGVLDDRVGVVRMWREDLGLTVLQVAPGEF